ncbi:MAG: ammonia channel protein [Deltaproteobacteria bacterium]|nr:MAG: ammonia channel protein [Deltaproteobacteria bacterium]
MNRKTGFFGILAMSILALAGPAFADELSGGDTAWVMTSSALVLLMLPGLALFYAGMVRSKNVLSTTMMSFICMGVIAIQWVVYGYSLAFGGGAHPLIGGLDTLMLSSISPETLSGSIPTYVFIAFQGMFAIITPALISGAVVERMKFSAFTIFIILWATLVYDPLCHWVWGEGGWLLELGALDFAGGTVVHISSGVSALAAILVLGKRRGFLKEQFVPHNLTMTLLGSGLLWFGWFGFNAGSSLAANGTAAMAFLSTNTASAAGLVGWLIIEKIKFGKPSALGAASGCVAGLVAITPGAGFITPAWAIPVGFIAGILCFQGVCLKNKFGYDDSLDVLGVHGIGGTWGAIATGLVATVGTGSLITGDIHQLWVQVIGVLAAATYAFVVTFIIIKVLDAVIGIRASEAEEIEGLDQSQHGEVGYSL